MADSVLIAVILPSVSIAADLNTKTPTFAKDVAPILQEKCQACHRAGSMAPMSLVTYEETRPWAKSIKQRVVTRNMPPWHIDKTVGIQQFQNDISLSDEQIGLIARWVDAGAPLGDPKDMPRAEAVAARRRLAARQTVRAAGLGPQVGALHHARPRPGRVVQAAHANPADRAALGARGGDAARRLPAGRRITHHALAYLQQEEPGVNSDAPGNRHAGPADGMGGQQELRYLPSQHRQAAAARRAHLVGRASSRRRRGDPRPRRAGRLPLSQRPGAEVPDHADAVSRIAGAESSSTSRPTPSRRPRAITMLQKPARLENFQPHMHLRGKAMLLEAILPDGTKRTLSYVDHFNFNWMTNYIYADDAAPVLPKGTIIHVVAWHDNTANNKNNPDPNQWVGWGDRTVDEMAHAWVNVTYITRRGLSGRTSPSTGLLRRLRSDRCSSNDVRKPRDPGSGRGVLVRPAAGLYRAAARFRARRHARLRRMVPQPRRKLQHSVRILQPESKAGAGYSRSAPTITSIRAARIRASPRIS